MASNKHAFFNLLSFSQYNRSPKQLTNDLHLAQH